jgi:hypothetical protein
VTRAAGIIDQNVDPLIEFQGALDDSFGLIGFAGVGAHEDAARRLGRGVAAFLVASGENDGSAVHREGFDDFQADAAAAAGDDGGFSDQPPVEEAVIVGRFQCIQHC